MTAQPPDKVRLTPRSLAKRAQILKAAQRLFLQDGFASTSMDAIHSEARVSKPTLYNHFDSKEKLFVGVIEHSLEDISDVWEGIATESSQVSDRSQLAELLLQLAHRGVEHLLSPQTVRLARTLVAEGRGFPGLGREFRARVPRRARRLIAAVLSSAHEQGLLSIRAEQIPTAVNFFQAQLLSYLLLNGLLVFEDDPIPPPGDELKSMVDLYMQTIC